MPKRWWLLPCLASLLLWSGALFAAGQGDPVFFTGPESLDIAGTLSVGGLPVSTSGGGGGGTSTEYSPARVASTGNVTVSSPGTSIIDGVSLASGNSVVLWQQTAAAENGIYLFNGSGSAMTRRSDMDLASEFTGHRTVYVQEGGTYQGVVFRVTNTSTPTLGSTAIVLAPQPSLWYTLPLQTLDPGQAIACNPPTNGPAVGVVAYVAGTEPDTTLAIPQLVAGLHPGQLCLIFGADAINTIELSDGDGVTMVEDGGSLTLGDRSAILLSWTGTLWRQADQAVTGGGGGGAVSIQEACETGADCGPTSLPEAHPWVFKTLNGAGARMEIFGEDGNLYFKYLNADGTRASPPAISLFPSTEFVIEALLGDSPPAWQTVGRLSNDPVLGFVREGLFAVPAATEIAYEGPDMESVDVAAMLDKVYTWHLPWTAAGAMVDGTNCVKATTAVVLNAGPRVLPITCADAAGEIEFNFDTPARYDGGELTVCFRVNDDTFDSTDDNWDVAVIAQFRPSGAAVNNTWSSPVEAAVTMSVADASYYACAAVTPNAAAAGVGTVYIKATVDNAGGHDDSNARVLGGYVTGH